MKKRIILSVLAVLVLVSAFAVASLAEDMPSGYLYTDDGQIDLLGYFEMEGVTATLEDEAICFTLTAQNASISFKRPQTADGFSFRWNGVADSEKKLETIGLTLTDTQNADCAVSINYRKMNDQYCSVQCNAAGRTYLSAGSMYMDNSADISMFYSDEGNSFADGAGFYLTIEKYLNGTDFKGFPSGGVNMRLDLTGQVGGSFRVRAINEQRFGKLYVYDDSEPVLGLRDPVDYALQGSVVTVRGAVAFDVLRDESTVTLTVKDPAGEIVKDINGTALEDVDGTKDYQFKVEQFGFYNVSYVTSDGVNKSRGMGYRMNVMDQGGPQIVLDKAVPALTVGEAYTFPTMTVTDNSDGECQAWITVMHPTGIMTIEEGSFIPETEGNYTIYFMAVDASGNVGRVAAETHAKKGE